MEHKKQVDSVERRISFSSDDLLVHAFSLVELYERAVASVQAKLSEEAGVLSEEEIAGQIASTSWDGQGVREVPGFAPANHELYQLAKYWYHRLEEVNFRHYLDGEWDGYELRLRAQAEYRLGRIEAAIGSNAVDRAIEVVRKNFERKHGDLWRAYMAGIGLRLDENHRLLTEEQQPKLPDTTEF